MGIRWQAYTEEYAHRGGVAQIEGDDEGWRRLVCTGCQVETLVPVGVEHFDFLREHVGPRARTVTWDEWVIARSRAAHGLTWTDKQLIDEAQAAQAAGTVVGSEACLLEMIGATNSAYLHYHYHRLALTPERQQALREQRRELARARDRAVSRLHYLERGEDQGSQVQAAAATVIETCAAVLDFDRAHPGVRTNGDAEDDDQVARWLRDNSHLIDPWHTF